jgi:hypothetical protein
VGSGSLHASGFNYETVKGYPQDTDFAPDDLIFLLERPTFFRVSNNGQDLDIDEQHIVNLLAFVNADCDYNEWVSVGMAIHHCLNGGGFEIVGRMEQHMAQNMAVRQYKNTGTQLR